MNKERLLRLADHMDKVKPKQYWQDTYFETDGPVTSRKFEFENLVTAGGHKVFVKEGFCNSTGCVLGHAASMKDMGVFLYLDAGDMTTINGRRGTRYTPQVRAIDPKTGNVVDGAGEHGAKAFGISVEHFDVLFDPSNEPRTYFFYVGRERDVDDEADLSWDEVFHKEVTPQVVAQRLREYVASDGKTIKAVLRRYPSL
jgi:hypothetical protein